MNKKQYNFFNTDQDYNFTPPEKYKHTYSAGILPYQVDENNQVFFLLGKDSDGYWSDFGGKCEAKDKNCIIQTAAREFYEESLGSILNQHSLRSMLKNQSNYKFVNSCSNAGIRYYMFILRIPMLKDTFRDRFQKTHNFLKFIHRSSDNTTIGYEFFEKTDIKWISMNTLLSILHNEKKEKELGWPLRKVFKKTLFSCKDTILEIKNEEMYV